MPNNKGNDGAGFDVQAPGDLELHDDHRQRNGTVWTATAHVITAVIGSGILSLPWATAQLGWIGGPAVLATFALITYNTSCMLADCYRTSDPVSGRRNYTYRDAVKSNLGKTQVWFCGLCQYGNLFGTSNGYTITASISAAAVMKANCFHKKGHNADCSVLDSMYMMGFGVIQIFLSQLPNFHEIWWLSIVAALMSFAYSLIAVGLCAPKVISGHTGRTSITGTEVGVDVNSAQKIWLTFQALGDIAFAYSYAMILIEIQDTLKSPLAENKTMKKASFLGVSTTTTFYILCGCLGYTAFGNHAPGNILTGFGFYEPYWLIDFAIVCIIIHLFGAYQVFCQPLFAAVEEKIAARGFRFNSTIFRAIWRTSFVMTSTLLAIMFPFFNDVLALLGAVAFWPLTVYFPVEMYISQKKIAKFSRKWLLLQSLSLVCFVVSLVAAIGSIQGVVVDLHHYTPFKTKS